MHVYSEIMPCDSTVEELEALNEFMNLKGLILSGSPASIRLEKSPRLGEGVLEMGLPVLGLCYGHQLIAHMHGGEVKRGTRKEYGITSANISTPDGVLHGLGSQEKVWMSHGDTVFSVPQDFIIQAYTDISPVAAYRHKEKQIHGLQWHPEVVHTEHGGVMLQNFVFNVCDCSSNWHSDDMVESAVEEIQAIVGESRAIIALSGGVDSSVAATLAAKALGDRLVAVHVDHGFMRVDESQTVKKTFQDLDVDLIVVEAQDQFLEKLVGVFDPEVKRKIIGEEFIKVFEEEARKAEAEYLIQGTIYPDRIESGLSKHSDTIKTHHNVGGLPLHMEFIAVVEPLRDLYKDEVRNLGRQLGLPATMINRQPFPGPGLAIRVMGDVTREKLSVLRKADAIVCEEVESSSLKETAWQYLAVLTNTRSTGVKGDERAYGVTVAIRIVESVDGMTAGFAKAPWSVIECMSTRITNEIPEVTRVVYDVTHKPPATIEWE
jgi:GMP synthase (glutamine-hydrolysing)